MNSVEDLTLWAPLRERGTDEQRVLVRRLAGFAGPILDRVLETFPTYTLHNATHARQVAGLMAAILGPQLAQLSALEAAMLILAAYFHDVGMVFSPDERARLADEPEWSDFLRAHPEAFIEIEQRGLTPDVAEWYCRWRHADRVTVWLAQLDDHDLGWGVVSLREPLAALCRSHNESTRTVIDNDVLQPQFLAEADLKFCAILLRLADILDFDRVRSPDSVYRYLGLARRDTPRHGASDVEWRKHLCSEGFRFPDERAPGFTLGFIASPEEPAVDHDVRQFLDGIEAELAGCAAALAHCSRRWQTFPLPGRIDRRNILSTGYRYGEYRFSFDQQRVLGLLMGENLYDHPYAFVRELLQNAIDTSRHRQFFERARGDAAFEPGAITVSEWRDRDGYQWVRFDDGGMGMDEEIVLNYLLKVGASFYSTPRFRAEVIRARRKGAPDFVPISRFGIGLLSCFVAGDRVDVNTRHLRSDGSRGAPVRLSLNGLHGFYALQTGDLLPAPMPSAGGDERGYRREPGTSIAVRLDPRKERGRFELRGLLGSFLLYPPVPVELEGERIGGDPAEIEQPWCERRTVRLTGEQMQEIGRPLGISSLDPLEIEVVPIDLTRNAATPHLKGQMILVYVRPAQKDWEEFVDVLIQVGFRLSVRLLAGRDGVLELALSTTISPDGVQALTGQRPVESEAEAATVARIRNYRLFPELAEFLGRFQGASSPRAALAAESYKVAVRLDGLLPANEDKPQLQPGHRSVEWLAHNGVKIPTGNADYTGGIKLAAQSDDVTAVFSWGVIALADVLRPDVSVGRSRIVALPWRISSHVNLAFMRAAREMDVDPVALGVDTVIVSVRGDPRVSGFTSELGELLEDDLTKPDGSWAHERIIPVSSALHGARCSLRDLLASLRGGAPVALGRLPEPDDFLFGSKPGSTWQIAALVLRRGAAIALRMDGRLVATAAEPDPLFEGEKLFPPLAFVRFLDSKALRRQASYVNREHPLARWLIDAAPALRDRFPGILDVLRSRIFSLIGSGPDLERDIVGPINEALARLRDLDHALAPPKRLDLARADIDLR